MARRILVVIPLLFALTACRQEQPSLQYMHAAPSVVDASDQRPSRSEFNVLPAKPRSDVRSITDTISHARDQFCYSFMLRRPKSQRARAVQARLEQADRMTAAFDSHLLTVDLLGDHANVLSLQFPVVYPARQSYADLVSSIVEDYFASPDVEDYLCNSGFAEVRLSAWGLNDHRMHPIWKAQVTSEGLIRVGNDDQQVAASDPLALH